MRYSSLHNCEHFVKCKQAWTGNEKSEKAIGFFVSGSETNQLGWIPRETISEVERMGRMEDLEISLITFKEKEISFQFSKIDCVIKISSSEM